MKTGKRARTRAKEAGATVQAHFLQEVRQVLPIGPPYVQRPLVRAVLSSLRTQQG